MNERYKPKQLVRERAAKGDVARAVAHALSLSVSAPVIAPVFTCNHGEPWRECTTCSKPRTK